MTKHIYRRLVLAILCLFFFVSGGCAGGVGGGFGGGGGFGLTASNEGQELAGDSAEDSGTFFEAAVDTGVVGDSEATHGVGGFDQPARPAPANTGAEGQNKGQFSSSEPVDIPVTIAKATKPNVEQIEISIVDVNESVAEDGQDHDESDPDEQDAEDSEHPQGFTKKSYMMAIRGLAGAIPNPAENSFVYVFDPVTGKEIFSKVAPDGSFEPIELVYQLKAPLVVAVSDQLIIGEPLYLRAPNTKIYTWRTEPARKPFAVATFENKSESRIFIVRDVKNQAQESAKEGLMPDKRGGAIDSPLINRGSDNNKQDLASDSQVSRDLSVSIRNKEGDVSVVKDVRRVDETVVFNHQNEIFRQDSEKSIDSVYKTDRGEVIKRWGVVREKENIRRDAGNNPDGRSDGIAGRVNYIALVTNKAVRLVDSNSAKIIMEKNIEDVSDVTYLLLEREAPLENIMSALVQGR